MKNRIKMNTKSLQESFLKIYENFFSQCSIVISTCQDLFWSANTCWRIGAVNIKQKLPIKNYIGLKINNTGLINIKDILVYDQNTKTFKKAEYEYFNWEKIINFLMHEIKKNEDISKFKGFDIYILLELEEARGIN